VGSIPNGVTGIFYLFIILPAAVWPCGRLSLNRIEYHGSSLGVQAAGAQG
jgi:hypothetical protein